MKYDGVIFRSYICLKLCVKDGRHYMDQYMTYPGLINSFYKKLISKPTQHHGKKFPWSQIKILVREIVNRLEKSSV